MKINSPFRFTIVFFIVILFYQILIAGENTWTTNGPAGGNIKTVAFHPFDHNIIYLGTIGNGIYKSIDGGNSWAHLTIGLLSKAVWVIQFDFQDPDTMYASGTRGIFKSSDAGRSWEILPLQPNPYSAFMVHPDSQNLMFAGFFGGFRSNNGGQNWYPLNLPSGTGIERFSLDPINKNIIYLIGGNTPIGNGIFKSSDFGESWISIQNNLDSTGFCRELAIDPVNTTILYLARSQSAGESGHCLSKSTDSGQSWFDITPDGISDTIICDVIVSPFDHNTVYIASFVDGAFKSTDGGHSWIQKNNGLRDLICHSIEIDPVTGVLFLCLVNDGIYKSIDGGEHWVPISQNINMSTCLDLAFNPRDTTDILLSTNNGLFRNDGIEGTWRRIELGAPQQIVFGGLDVDAIDPIFIYGCSYIMPNTGYPPGFWRSVDGGANWEFWNGGLPGNTNYVDMAVSYSENQERRIFIASHDGLYYSDDFGESWEMAAGGLPSYNPVTVVAVSNSNPNVIALGDYYNHVYISIDRGINWHRTNDPPQTLDGYIVTLQFDPRDDSCIYISSTFSGIIKSTDRGRAWASILNDLPIDPLTPQYPVTGGIAINPYNSNNLFVSSTHMGIYQSHDGGQHWESFNIGLDTAGVFSNCLYFFPNDTTRLIIPSIMRSVWSIHRTLDGVDDDAPTLPSSLSLSSYPNPFNAQTTISYSLAEPGPVTLTIYNLLGQKVATLFDGVQTAGEHKLVWDAQNQLSGVYFCRLHGENFTKSSQMVLLR
jgi:photosystem II stability/assembly factor-like uncharacterized protein